MSYNFLPVAYFDFKFQFMKSHNTFLDSVSLKQYLINLELDAYCLPKLTVYFFSSSYMYVWQFLSRKPAWQNQDV